MASTYSFYIKHITLPAPPSFLSHHSIALKWRCGSQRGKMPLLAVRNGIIDADSIDKVPLLRIDLPPTMRATLVVEGKSTLVSIDVILVRHTDSRREAEKKRETLASDIPLDLGTVGARLGIPQEAVLKLGKHGSLVVEFSSGALRADNAETSGTAPDNEGASHSATLQNGGVSSEPFEGLVNVSIPEGSDIFTTADAELMKGIACTPGAGALTSLYSIVNEGLFKATMYEEPPEHVANILFFAAGNRTVWDAFHLLREDDPPEMTPWKSTRDRNCLFRTLSPRLRYGKGGKKMLAVEHCFLCMIDNDFVARTVVYSNEMPVVGSGVKLDLVFHVASDGAEGSVVAAFVYITATDMAKRLGGSMIAKYTDKIMGKAVEALNGLLVARRMQGRHRGRRSYQNLKFRNSLALNDSPTSASFNSSLDPCLWRRLTATDTLPNKEVVYQYLLRLLTIKILRVSESHVSCLESVIVYHRENARIVSAACNLLLMLCKASSFAVVYKLSPTLVLTLEQIFSLHSPGEFTKYQELVAHLLRHHRQAQREQEEVVAKGGNVWGILETTYADESSVELCLRTALTRWRDLTYQQVLVLTKALALHMQSEVISRYALDLVSKSQGSVQLLPEMTVRTLLIAAERHNLESEYEGLIKQISSRSFSSFERTFGYLGERYVFRSAGWLTAPQIARIQIYLTATYLVVGSFVLPLDSIQRVVQYRSFTLRKGLRVLISGSHDDYCFIASKRRELLVLLDRRRIGIEPPLEAY